MIKHIILLISTLLVLSGCSSDNAQKPSAQPEPAAAMESIERSSSIPEADSVKKEALQRKKTPDLLINVEDDDMPRLD